jgi:polyphosphate kinase
VDFGEDATNLFNLLTGICQFPGMNKLIVAPFDLHARLLQLIAREAEQAKRGLPARVIAKCNSLVEPALIEALYAASQAGVKIDLIVRGICCLRPGVPGLSENITVRSIVDRFLEHSRIYYFENACQPEMFIGSADWMPRNLFRRIEVVFPIDDGILCDRVFREILGVTLADNTKARFLGPDGIYRRATTGPGDEPHRSQTEFIALAMPKAVQKAKETYPRVELAASPFAKGEKKTRRLKV